MCSIKVNININWKPFANTLETKKFQQPLPVSLKGALITSLYKDSDKPEPGMADMLSTSHLTSFLGP